MSREAGRSCGDIRKLLWLTRDAWQVQAEKTLRAPRCKIKRRGKNVWLHLAYTLPDGARLKRGKKIVDEVEAMRFSEWPVVWITGYCDGMILSAEEDMKVNQKSIRQQALTLNGAAL